MKKKKSLLAILLAACLMLGVIPFTATAAVAPVPELVVNKIDLLTADLTEYPAGVSFDSDTNTLTLDNATLVSERLNSGYCIRTSGDTELNLVLIGENSISDYARAINAESLTTLNISGTGTLDISNSSGLTAIAGVKININSGALNIDSYHSSIGYSESLTISGGKVTLTYGESSTSRGIEGYGNIIVSDAELALVGKTSSSYGIVATQCSFIMKNSTLAINAQETAMAIDGDISFVGGSATVTSAANCGVCAYNNLYASADTQLAVTGYPALYSTTGAIVLGDKKYEGNHSNITMTSGESSYSIAQVGTVPVTYLVVGGINILTADAELIPEGVSYESQTQTLTLNGAQLDNRYSFKTAIITDGDLTLNLVGNNVITADRAEGSGIFVNNLQIVGDGSLNINALMFAIRSTRGVNIAVDQSSHIELTADLAAISNYVGSVTALGEAYNGFATFDNTNGDKKIVVDSGAFTVPKYQIPITMLEVNGVDLLATSAENYPAGVSYDSAKQLLTLENVNINTAGGPYGDGIYALGDLTINLVGENTLGDAGTLEYGIDSDRGTFYFTGSGSIDVYGATPIYCANTVFIDDTVTIKTFSDNGNTIACRRVVIGGEELSGYQISGNELTITGGKIVFPTEVTAIEYRINGGAWQPVPGVLPENDTRYKVTLPREVGVDGATVELRVTTSAEKFEVDMNDAPAVIEQGYTYIEFVVRDSESNINVAYLVVSFTTSPFNADLDAVTVDFDGTASGEQQSGADGVAALNRNETVTFDIGGLTIADMAPMVNDTRYVIKSVTLDETDTTIWDAEQGVGSIDTSTLTEGSHTIKLVLEPQVYQELLTGYSASDDTKEYAGKWISYSNTDGTEEVAISFTVLPVSTDPTDPAEYTLGDIDGNGDINVVDALLALRFAVGKTELTENQKLAANVNNDDAVTTSDALLILRRATGKINIFPCETQG